MMKKMKFLLASLCVAFVAVLTLGFVTISNPATAKAEDESYTYDTATIYDWAEISSYTEARYIGGNNVMLNTKTGGTGFVNKGIKFKLTFNQEDNTNYDYWRFQIGIGPDNCQYTRTDTYYFGVDWGWSIWHWDRDTTENKNVKVYTVGVSGGDRIARTNNDPVFVEFSVVKAYNSINQWVGNLATLKLNGKTEVSHFDAVAEYTYDITNTNTGVTTTYAGGYQTRANSADRMRSLDGLSNDLTAVGDNGLPTMVETVYSTDDVTVYDYYDASGYVYHDYGSSSNTASDYVGDINNKKIWELSSTHNMALRMKLYPDTGRRLERIRVNFGFFTNGTTDSGYWLTQEWGAKVTIGSSGETLFSDKTERGANLTEFILEVGVAKAYDGDEWYGNYFYASLNGTNFVSVIDTTEGYKTRVGGAIHAGSSLGVYTFAEYNYATTLSNAEVAPKAVANAGVSMVNGASVRYGGAEDNGLKFTMEVAKPAAIEELVTNKVVSAVSYGIVILPADYVTADKALTVDNLFVNNAFGDIINLTTTELYEQKSGNMGYAGSIINILEANITRAFVGVGYVKYTIDSVDTYVLANFYENDIANNTRSMYEVAKAAYEDVDADEDVKSAVKAAYLDKCASYTANYYYGDDVITETYVGVIGQTTFAPYVAIEGYEFDAANANNVTTGVVVADGTLVLNYYYAAVVAE